MDKTIILLAEFLPSDALIADRDVAESFERDEAQIADAGTPLAVVRATIGG